MTNVDQFESVFRSAAKSAYSPQPVKLKSVLVVTDFEKPRSVEFSTELRSYLDFLSHDSDLKWTTIGKGDYSSIGELLDRVESEKPDLICSYRNLFSDAWRWPYSLGEYIDLLTQVTSVPVLLCPHPESGRGTKSDGPARESVMALTDHLTQDARLVDYAVRFAREGGKLVLAHIEDRQAFDRYVDVISRIPALDTETAHDEILSRLVKEPTDYVASCRAALEAAKISLRVEEEIGLGHRLSECVRLIEDHRVELLVVNTKDTDQMAMHGLAYPLAVEFRQIPMLMI
ncbi:MAG: hypothetical protein AAF517_01435 [Planctomycetota bacterium]